MTTRAVIAVGMAAALAATASCGDDGLPLAIGDPPRFPVPGCEAFNGPSCDVLATACQQRLLELAGCLRGSPAGALPPVSRMTEQEFAALLAAEYAATPPPDPNHFERALSILRLVEPGGMSPAAMAAMRAAQIAGVYRPDEKDVILVDHGRPSSHWSDNATLLHEMVHALQDREVDFREYFEGWDGSPESNLALNAIVEGEARFHQSRYLASLLGLDPATIDWAARFEEAVVLGEAAVMEEPSPYLIGFSVLPYQHGARLIHARFEAGGRAAIAQLFASPPTSTRALLVPDGFPLDFQPPGVDPSPTPPPDWSLVADTRLGAWVLFLALARTSSTDQARPLAGGWRGDAFRVYAGPGSYPGTAFAWSIVLADESSARAVADLLRTYPLSVVLRGRVVTAASADWLLAPA